MSEQTDDTQSPSERTERDGEAGVRESRENPPATQESDESVSEDINEAFEPDPQRDER